MNLDSKGLALLAKVESCSLTAYPDAGGWSIGFGHHGSDVYKGMKISMAQAKEFLRQDVAEAEACISRNFAGITLTQNEFNAMVSMAYNRGCSGFVSSDVAKLIKQQNKTGAAQVWLSSGITIKGTDGKTSDSLVSRRAQEAAMFAGGTVKKAVSRDTAAAIPAEEEQSTNLIDTAVRGVPWGTLGWLGFIVASVWAGNKYGVPAWKKAMK